ncbi:von Willebrand factor type A domain-containing protein [Promicromonospora thailandica]|uniref:Ca-activated chloride channel family protein n=1 Tax=Promicromonospora thailandica TaxID=765201 RepID=A0A9X2JUM5_9MICO|nr:von Willebrand factor type A domain-containing protein [Promicromonospora thailandica]MCP2263178.1 Ca-activated chloride channel family protein [Promicromonospora thailandica]BFF18564.1 VWA domain-containing protein [Promicromonospora thailandica]
MNPAPRTPARTGRPALPLIVPLAAALTVVLALAGCGDGGDGAETAPDAVSLSLPDGGTGEVAPAPVPAAEPFVPEGREEYDDSPESPFQDVATSPLSTFSADVDTASYSNLRRQVNQGVRPEGVRIEELVNYFDYGYPAPAPDAEHPFTVTTEVAAAPWNAEHQLAMVGVQATEAVPTSEGNNIVFLLDVSGSMDEPAKLPLLAESFALLVEQLDERDRVSIVTYAGDNRVVADSVPGSEHDVLVDHLRSLRAGGATGGADGLATAYELAEKNFVEGGNNRVVLATDGDFNVGPSTPQELTELIEAERESGVYVSVLGFGMGNLKDSTMEAIADHGNGNYAYVDTLAEARKVLVDEFGSTMFVVAQDLKVQVELNPATVASYRLIGYDNRRLDDEEFADDARDAGDVGAGHSVTAFYELVPADADRPGSDGLAYSDREVGPSDDFMTVHVRYKEPGGGASTEAEFPVGAGAFTTAPTADFAFASAVAELGLIATGSEYRGAADLDAVRERAAGAVGADPYGLRAEFVDLVDAYPR